MKWEVTGADRQTGNDTSLIVEADDEASARRRANRQGLLVADVRALEADDSVAGEVVRMPPSGPQPTIQERAPAMPAQILPRVPQEIPVNNGCEKDIWNATPSLWIGLRTYFWCGFLSLLCVFVAAFSGLAILGILPFMGIVALRVLRIKAIHYHLTTERLRISFGILSRKIIEIELFRIRDLSVEQGFIMRLMSLGAVRAISTDEDAQIILMSGIKDPMTVKENLRTFVMASRKATGTRDLDMSVVR